MGFNSGFKGLTRYSCGTPWWLHGNVETCSRADYV